MNSDTPRTDAILRTAGFFVGDEDETIQYGGLRREVRQLERELAEAKEQLFIEKGKHNDAKEDRDQWRSCLEMVDEAFDLNHLMPRPCLTDKQLAALARFNQLKGQK